MEKDELDFGKLEEAIKERQGEGLFDGMSQPHNTFGIYQYIPLTIDSFEKMRGIKIQMPRNLAGLQTLLNDAFVIGYTRGESDTIRNAVPREEIIKAYASKHIK